MTTYTEVFGGTNIYPSGVSYLSIDVGLGDVQLAWPVETGAPADGTTPAARIMNVTASNTPLLVIPKVVLPQADQASVGECFLFNNVSTETFDVVNFDLGAVCVVAPGELWQVYMTSNSSSAGSWVAYQFGSVLSVANSAALAGYGLKAISATLNQALNVINLNSDYEAGVSDRAKVLNWVGSSGQIDLITAPTLGNDWFIYVRNSGDSAITIYPYSGESINGSPSLLMNPGDSAIIMCDGSSFYTVGLGKSATSTFDYTEIDISGTGNYTLSGFELNHTAYDLTGTLTGNRNVIVPATVQQYWIANNTTGAYSVTVKVSGGTGVVVLQGSAAILYANGTDVVSAQTLNIAVPVTVPDGGTGATSAGGALINLGGTSIGIAVFTAATQDDAQTAIGITSATDTLSLVVALS